MVCPICGKDALPRAANAAAPFCSPRCKVIDLGTWLNEGYRVPTDDDPSDEGPPAPDRGGKEDR